jgi:hypothetical protein
MESVDAALLSAPEDIRAAADGLRILLDVGTEYRLPWGGVSATRETIRRNRSEVERFVRRIVRHRAITEPQNKKDVTAWLGRFFKLDEKMSDEFLAGWCRHLIPAASSSAIKLVIDSAIERGRQPAPRS